MGEVREGDPHVAVLDAGQHLLLRRRRRVAAEVAQALEDVGAARNVSCTAVSTSARSAQRRARRVASHGS